MALLRARHQGAPEATWARCRQRPPGPGAVTKSRPLPSHHPDPNWAERKPLPLTSDDSFSLHILPQHRTRSGTQHPLPTRRHCPGMHAPPVLRASPPSTSRDKLHRGAQGREAHRRVSALSARPAPLRPCSFGPSPQFCRTEQALGLPQRAQQAGLLPLPPLGGPRQLAAKGGAEAGCRTQSGLSHGARSASNRPETTCRRGKEAPRLPSGRRSLSPSGPSLARQPPSAVSQPGPTSLPG